MQGVTQSKQDTKAQASGLLTAKHPDTVRVEVAAAPMAAAQGSGNTHTPPAGSRAVTAAEADQAGSNAARLQHDSSKPTAVKLTQSHAEASGLSSSSGNHGMAVSQANVVTFSSGTSKQELPDGTSITRFSNADVNRTHPDGASASENIFRSDS